MSATTTTCEAHELAILRRGRCDLDADDAARLDAHLAACRDCREFERSAALTTDLLRARADDAARTVDWDAARRAVARAERRETTGIVGVTLLTAVLAAANGWDSGPWAALVVGGAGAAALAAAVAFSVLPRRRRAREAARLDAELLSFVRARLDAQISGLQRHASLAWVVLALCGAVIALVAANLVKHAVLGWPLDWPGAANGALLATVIAGTQWYGQRVRLPGLLRERAEFGA